MTARPTRVAPRLYIGPRPTYSIVGFDVVVFAARQYQPRLPGFRGRVIHAGIDDQPTRGIDELEQHKTRSAAKAVARALYDGERVLVTCEMGLNRSALIAGLALRMCSRLSTEQIVLLIRGCRGEQALSNPSFVEYLRNAPVTQSF